MTRKQTLTGRDLMLKSMTEAQFRRQVITWAKREGWMVYSIHDSRPTTWGTDNGYPDLTLCRGGRLIIAELKREGGKPTLKQVDWMAALAVCSGVEVRLWRPTDEDDIKTTLAAGRSVAAEEVHSVPVEDN